jgi:hypothetical protein
MRQVTATEKYLAVLEGKMAKKEFVRQMRQQYPMYISNFDGFDSTVQILKTRKMLFEAPQKAFSGVKVYDDRPALTYSLDALDRGIRYELQGMELNPATNRITPEQLSTATKKAKDNLEKDANHYLNLLSGESSHTDKNDKMKETKRGAAEKDTFNDMKKASLKENIQRNLIKRITDHAKKTYVDGEIDLKHAMVPAAEDFYDLAKKEGDEDKMAIIKSLIRHYSALKENIQSAKENIIKVASVIRGKYGEIPGFNGLLKDFLQTHQDDIKAGLVTDPIGEFNDFVDLNYDRLDEKEGKDHDGDGDIVKYKGEDHEVVRRDGDRIYIRRAAPSAMLGKLNIFWVKPEDIKEDEDGPEVADLYQFDDEYLAKLMQMQREAQAKDLDGDGDIDSDDYMTAKDRAIKKAMGKEKQLKEAIKSIIKKTLSEGTLNEAATNELARLADDYEEFQGMKPAIIALQDIVTDIESFYDKTRQKIQKVYDSIGEIRNEEGLKVGGFLAPTIEAAFNKDLRPVTKVGFTGGLETPKVKTMSSREFEDMKAQQGIEEEPKNTVFTPIN